VELLVEFTSAYGDFAEKFEDSFEVFDGFLIVRIRESDRQKFSSLRHNISISALTGSLVHSPMQTEL